MMSAASGRPCAIQEESFDVEPPLEVDDDCFDLDDPLNNYPLVRQQPADRPALISSFIVSMRLRQILAFATRTLVSKFFSFSGRYGMGF